MKKRLVGVSMKKLDGTSLLLTLPPTATQSFESPDDPGKTDDRWFSAISDLPDAIR